MNSKVLLPCDGSDTSMKAATYAARLMKLNPQMKLTVLVVVPAKDDLSTSSSPDTDLQKKLDTVLELKASEVLKRIVEYFEGEGLHVDKVLKKGDPAQVILEHASQGQYDHIIMGSRGASELRGVAIGSVSHKVIHLAECRVTLVK